MAKSRCVFLTCDDLTGFVADDSLAEEALRQQCGIETQSVSWRAPADWSLYDFAVIRSTWDYTRHHQEFMATLERIEKSGCRLYNPLSIVRWNLRKTYLKELAQNGIPVIPSAFLEDAQGFSLIDSWKAEKLILKPIIGAGSSSIQVLEKKEMMTLAQGLSEHERKEWFVQPFISEVVRGEHSLHFFNKRFSHAIRKVPKQGDFRVQEEFGADIIPHRPSEQELGRAGDILKMLPNVPLLYCRVDLLPWKDDFYVMELELIEPALYFRTDAKAPEAFVRAVQELCL